MITIEQLKEYARGHFYLARLLPTLSDKHWQYCQAILDGMKEDTESAMNDSWSRLAQSQKCSDKLGRAIPEMIANYISSKKRGAK